jgi:hypothetical protein
MSKPRLNVGKITKNSLAYSRFTDLEMFNLVHVTVASPQNAYLHFAAWILPRYLRLFFPRCYAHITGIQRHRLRLQIPPSFRLVRLASSPWNCRAMQYTDFMLPTKLVRSDPALEGEVVCPVPRISEDERYAPAKRHSNISIH